MSTQNSQEINKVLTAVDRSTKSLTNAADQVAKVASEVQGLAKQAADLATDIEFKQNELTSLDAQLAVKVREQNAELNLQVLENQDQVLKTLLSKRKLVSIEASTLQSLEQELENVKENNQEAIDHAVNAAVREANNVANTKLQNTISDHKVATAEVNAKVTALTQRTQDLEAQNAQLREELKAEREARVKIAEAEANKQGVTVNTGK